MSTVFILYHKTVGRLKVSVVAKLTQYKVYTSVTEIIFKRRCLSWLKGGWVTFTCGKSSNGVIIYYTCFLFFYIITKLIVDNNKIQFRENIENN